MANTIVYKDTTFHIGDTVNVAYKIKEANKERIQNFSGILLRVKGNTPETKMVTVRKISKSGIGLERIFPLNSPYIAGITLEKKTSYTRKAKLYFIRTLSDSELRRKLYRTK